MSNTAANDDASTAKLQRDVGSLRTKLFYGFGSVAFGVKDNGFQTILLLFYNQVMHLPAGLVGLVLLAALCVDALFDPIIGQISDNLRTRWGRRHPLLYISALPVAISYLLLWNPPHWSQGALLIYLFVVSVVVRTFISFYEIPSSALNPELTESYDQRTALSSYRVFFAWYGGMAMYLLAFRVFLAPDATHKIGQLNETGYSHYGLTAAVIMFCAILISALGTHKFIPILRKPPARALSLWQYAREMFATLYNFAFFILMLAQVSFGIATGLVFAINTYLVTFFWELSNKQVFYLGLGTLLAVLLAFFVALPVSRRLGKRKGAMILFASGLSISIVPIVLRLSGHFLPNGSPWLVPVLFAFGAISGAMTIGSSVLMSAMLADVVEDSELKTGRRSEGLFFAGSSFMAKAVSGFGIAASGLLLWLIDFPQDAVPGHVDAAVVRNLALFYLPTVVILYGLGIFIISFFPIDRASHEENLRRLAAEAALVPASEHP